MVTRTVRILPVVVTAGFLLLGCGEQKDARVLNNEQHAAAIAQIVSSSPSWVERDRIANTLWDSEQRFYESRQHAPAWIDGDRATARLGQLMDALRHADDHGIDPTRYGTSALQKAIDAAGANKGRYTLADVPTLDARFTYAYLRYAADLLGWTGDPQAIYAQWVVTPRRDDLTARLQQAVSSNDVRQSLEELAPAHPQYKGLQAALAREKTNATGHADQIRINLERWRWMPELEDRYVLVNVPAYQMQVMDAGRSAVSMRVIVGAPANPTPLFNDEMTNVVFSPTWNIPETIIRKEMVPHQVKDPFYLQRQNIEAVGTSGDPVDLASVDWSDEETVNHLRLRQAPGPANALGLVKFIFPNQFDVYLHDTPTDSLFNKSFRALSHGCVRLENPVALASYVLSDKPQWTTEKISEAMNGEQEQAVPLARHLPVHIGYWTAWVNEDGSVTYTDDPYKLDQKQAALEHLTVPPPAQATPKA